MKRLIYLLTNRGEQPTVLTIIVIIVTIALVVFSWIIGPMLLGISLIRIIIFEVGLIGLCLFVIGLWRFVAFVRFTAKHRLENPRPH